MESRALVYSDGAIRRPFLWLAFFCSSNANMGRTLIPGENGFRCAYRLLLIPPIGNQRRGSSIWSREASYQTHQLVLPALSWSEKDWAGRWLANFSATGKSSSTGMYLSKEFCTIFSSDFKVHDISQCLEWVTQIFSVFFNHIAIPLAKSYNCHVFQSACCIQKLAIRKWDVGEGEWRSVTWFFVIGSCPVCDFFLKEREWGLPLEKSSGEIRCSNLNSAMSWLDDWLSTRLLSQRHPFLHLQHGG